MEEKFKLEKEAREDLAEAFLWYESQKENLGDEFVNNVFEKINFYLVYLSVIFPFIETSCAFVFTLKNKHRNTANNFKKLPCTCIWLVFWLVIILSLW